jgi:hypothetical protein
MKITREINGETVEIELTNNELNLAYEVMKRMIWKTNLEDAIAKNSDNLRFTEFATREDFLAECMDEMEDRHYADDYEEECDEIVFDMAETDGIWIDDPEYDDDEDEEDEW